MTQRVARPMKFAAFISIIISVAVMLAACQGAVGKAGDGGATGPTGPTGPPGRDATPNTPPALKADKTLGTQHLALANRTDTTGIKKISVIPISTYFEDPEGIASLTYSVAELSADDKKIANVFLTAVRPAIDRQRRASPATTPRGRCPLEGRRNWFGFLGYRSFDSRHGDA